MKPVLLLAVLLFLWCHTTIASTTVPYPRRSLAGRALHVAIDPNTTPKSVPFDNSLQIGSPDIASDDPRIVKEQPGCEAPEQIHLTFWTSTSVLVSWATCDAQVAEKVTKPQTADGVSLVLYGKAPTQLNNSAVGMATGYVYNYSAIGKPSYASPILHHVLLTDLEPGCTYYYSPASTNSGDVSESQVYHFTLPKPTFPINIGVMADPGQTYNTSVMLDHLRATTPELVLLVGDFTYADTWLTAETENPPKLTHTYQPKWDTWSRLFQPLLAYVPVIHTNGNHEIEQQPSGVRNTAYNYRFPTPQKSHEAPIKFTGTTKSNPYTNLYYSVELPGVFKSISLTSYSIDQKENGFNKEQEQYKWLEQELQNTDRTATPWLIVLIHAPWYNTYSTHFKENECMREMYEWLMIKYNVDLIFFGHVHAYERVKPVNNYKLDECGPVHITIGDGGNVEGTYKDFIDTINPRPAYCADPNSGKQFPSYQPQKCLTYQDGEYCYTKQPDWSAYREPSFGHGNLQLLNATHAKWTWTKNQWPVFNVADEVTIRRTPKDVGACGY